MNYFTLWYMLAGSLRCARHRFRPSGLPVHDDADRRLAAGSESIIFTPHASNTITIQAAVADTSSFRVFMPH